MKPIRFSKHSREQLSVRGFATSEVEEAIATSAWKPADDGCMECRKRFPFNQQWRGKDYRFIEVRPIFVENDHEIVVVTVYTYFY